MIPEYKQKLQKQLEVFEPIGITFEISLEVFLQRISEPVPPEKLRDYIQFFDKIKKNTREIYTTLGIKHYIIDNNGPVDETYQKIVHRLRENNINYEGNIKRIEKQ